MTDKVGDVTRRAKIREAFILFEHKEGSRLLDPRDVPATIRSLGVNPSAAMLNTVVDQLALLTADSDTPLITLEHFESVVATFLAAQEVALFREDLHMLLRAFRAFDPESKGWIELEALKLLLSTKAETMGEDELVKMAHFAGDEQGRVWYEDYAQKLCTNGRTI